MSRNNGKSGEREIAGIVRDLTGWVVQRRVRQHDGDSDLEGVPGWAVEVKRRASAGRADIAGWWTQTCEQARRLGERPMLFYRVDRDQWRAVWPLMAHLRLDSAAWLDYAFTVEGAPEAWATVAKQGAKA